MTAALDNLLSPLPAVLTIAQVSSVLNIPESETQSLLDSGSLVAGMREGHWQILKADLQSFIVARGNHGIIDSDSADAPA